ncbi:hypothetical protein SAY87_006866 [Trapa incisa]|uniref:Uncharacterized protein n=1 Tax=Trapa incisa TaxID=236973 RepID=A0AAN7Q069_9MYRT|nr:hypothetical protein SAY87_006866 [Trapa incisa]
MATEGIDAAVFRGGFLMARAGCVEAESGLGCSGCFPSEFPYEIHSPVNSVLSSSETTKSRGDVDVNEEDFFAELTSRLTRSSIPDAKKSAAPLSFLSKTEKPLVISVSPKSTLTGVSGWPSSYLLGMSRDASPNGGSTPSPPVAPFPPENSQINWDLIYAAAEQVARLRLSGEEGKVQPLWPVKSHGLTSALKPPLHGCCSSHISSDSHSVTNQYWNTQDLQFQRACSPCWSNTVKGNFSDMHTQPIGNRIRGIGYESNNVMWDGGRLLGGAPHSDLLPLCVLNAQQSLNRPDLRALLNGSGTVKRERAGTGVFLPRRYGNPAPESRKRSGFSTVLVPPKVVQALNLNLDDVNARRQPHLASDYGISFFLKDSTCACQVSHIQAENIISTLTDILMARRNAILEQQKSLQTSARGSSITKGVLPQEWTY